MDDMEFLEGISFPEDNIPGDAFDLLLESPGMDNRGSTFSPKFGAEDSKPFDNIRDAVLAGLACNSTNALQAEFAAAVGQQLKNLWACKRRRAQDLEYHPGKRLRTLDDDPFCGGLLGGHYDDMTQPLKGQQTNAGQETSNEVQQQKDALIRWFAERMFHLETVVQKIIDDNEQAHKSEIATLRRQQAEELQRQRDEISQANLAEMESLKRQHAQTLKTQIGGEQQDEFDTARLDMAEGEYNEVRKGISHALMYKDLEGLGRLLREETVKYDRFKEAFQEELLLMRCRQLNERQADHVTIVELNMALKKDRKNAAELMQTVKIRSQEVLQLSDRIRQLEPLAQKTEELMGEVNNRSQKVLQLSARIRQLEPPAQKSEELMGEVNKRSQEVRQMLARVQELEPLAQRVPLLMRENHIRSEEVLRLSDKVQELQPLAQKVPLLLEENEKLKGENTVLRKLSNAANMSAMQAQVGLSQQQTGNIRPQTLTRAQAVKAQCATSPSTATVQAQAGLSQQKPNQAPAVKAQCDQSLKRQAEAHAEELRRIINGFQGQIKGQRGRMEHLADKIKSLTQKNREKFNAMHDMALEMSSLKNQIEALRKAS